MQRSTFAGGKNLSNERVAPSGAVLLRFSQHLITVISFFYYDNTGTKRGPASREELQVLANQGEINPQTLLEMASGHNDIAGQISGLFPPNSSGSGSATTPLPKRDDDGGSNAPFSFVGWLCDFGFEQSYVMKILRLLATIFYIIAAAFILFTCVLLCFAAFGGTMSGLGDNEACAWLLLLTLPLILVGAVVFIVLTRLWSE